jgi:hypothetical protein
MLRPFKVIPGTSLGLSMGVRRGKLVWVSTQVLACGYMRPTADLWVQPLAVDMRARMCASWGCRGACRRADTRVRRAGLLTFASCTSGEVHAGVYVHGGPCGDLHPSSHV